LSLARLQRELDRPAEAAAFSLQRKALWTSNPVELYRVAEELILSARAMKANANEISGDKEAECQRLTIMAAAALRQAIETGLAQLLCNFPSAP